jgi:hypothetical protein
VLGHDLRFEPAGAIPGLLQWRTDLLLTAACLAAAAVYLAGVVRLRRRDDGRPVGRTVCWIGGLLVVLLTTGSGLARYAPVLFSAQSSFVDSRCSMSSLTVPIPPDLSPACRAENTVCGTVPGSQRSAGRGEGVGLDNGDLGGDRVVERCGRGCG